MFKADRRLKNFYDKSNRLYFDGKLPVDTEVGWNEELDTIYYGLTLGFSDEDTKHSFFQMHISTALKGFPEIARLTVLHEMAHIHLYPYMKHGKKFQDEMIRLAVRGAFKGLW